MEGAPVGEMTIRRIVLGAIIATALILAAFSARLA